MTMVLAHPLTEAARLGVAPAFVGLLAAVLTVGVARVVAVNGLWRPAAPAAGSRPSSGAKADSLALVVAGRALGLTLLGLAIAAGRLGPSTQIDNIAPALVIGVGWPALLLGSALLGGVWDWLHPFDTLAMGAERLAGRADTAEESSRPLWVGAVAGALGWTWWLGGHVPGGLEPRAIGLALGFYTLVTLAGCLWVGRETWLAQAEVFTVTFRAIAAARSAGVEAGAVVLPTMAVLIGGLAYAELRFSAWYLADLAAIGVDAFAAPVVVTGFVLACGAGLLTTLGAARWAGRMGVGDVLPIAAAWLVVGLGLSAAIERDRLWNAVQLLVLQTSDPLGRGWDLWDTSSRGVVGWPFGEVPRLWVQVAVLTTMAMIGLTISLRRVAWQESLPKNCGHPRAAGEAPRAPRGSATQVEGQRSPAAMRGPQGEANFADRPLGGRRGDPLVVFVAVWLVLAVLSAASL